MTPKEKADAMIQDDSLARSKGNGPEQIEARRRVALLFCKCHLPKETPELQANRLAMIDYTSPVISTNAKGIDINNPKRGFLGMGRKPAYFISEAIPPKKPEDPVYALEYFPLKT